MCYLEEKSPIGNMIIAQKEDASQHAIFQAASPIIAIPNDETSSAARLTKYFP